MHPQSRCGQIRFPLSTYDPKRGTPSTTGPGGHLEARRSSYVKGGGLAVEILLQGVLRKNVRTTKLQQTKSCSIGKENRVT